MKSLKQYITEATSRDGLKKIDTLRKSINKEFGDKIALVNHGSRYDKYWRIYIYQTIDKSEMEKLDKLIKAAFPEYDSKQWHKKDGQALLDDINAHMTDTITSGGATIALYPYQYFEVHSIDIK